MQAETTHITEVDAAGAAEPIMAGNAARKAYRANDSRLPDDVWRQIGNLIVDVAQERLGIVQDLDDAGLINPIGMGETISTWQETNEFRSATTDMDGRADAEEDASIWVTKGVPVPIHHLNFRVGHREGEAHPDLQPNNVQKTIRQVMERIETVTLDGWGAITDGRGDTFEIYGLRNHPDRNTHTGSDWATETNIEPDVQGMIDKAEGDNYYGPYNLYVGGDQWSDLRAPSSDFDNMRVRQQIEDLSEINAVRALDKLPDGEAVLVQMTSDVIDAVSAGDLVQTAEWNHTPFETRVKTFSIFAPRVKSDNGSQSGVVHATGL